MTARLSVASRRRSFITPTLVIPIVPIRLPLYLHLALAFLALTTLVAAGWAALVRQNIEPANPFSIYTEILPGQERDALIQQAFVCSTDPYYRLDYGLKDNEYCARPLPEGSFWLITSTVRDGVIRRTDFLARNGALTLGDLMFLWGRPRVRLYRQSARFEWPSLGISASGWAESWQFSYHMQVTRISINSTWNHHL